MQLIKLIKKSNIILFALLFSYQFSTSVYSMESDIELYQHANTNLNFEEVERLFESSGIKEKQNQLKEKSKNTLYSDDMSYIHEPFWSYNIIQLREYGKRIIEKIRPYFIDEASIDKGKVVVDGKTVKLRKVTEFGRILPLLYLKNQLEREKSKDKAVPRIFIFPNKDQEITFDFWMPYLKGDSRFLSLEVANNLLKVESDDFTIYQEYIEGEGILGDRSFIQHGHIDLNAKQIIRNKVDGKKYLIDTKESKNFYIPPLNPVSDSFYTYWTMKIGRILPQNAAEFQTWQREQQDLMLDAKWLHFPLDLPSIKVSVGKIDQLSPQMGTTAVHDFIFNDDSDETYFENIKDNLARYLKIRRYDLFYKGMDEYLDPSLEGVLVPGLFNYQETLIELGIDLLQCALFSKSEKDTVLLHKILNKLISRFDNTVEKEHIKLINLIAPKAISNPNYRLTFEQGMELFVPLLKKRKGDSGKVLDEAIIHGDIGLLEVVLSLFSDDIIIESTLKKTVSPPITGSFKDLAEEYRIQVIKSLLHKLPKVSNDRVNEIFSLNNKEVIDTLCEKTFEPGYALRAAVKIVNEPHLSHFRALRGDSSPVDYYWYTLVDRILAKDPPAEDIDSAIVAALWNSKITLLPHLLARKPEDSPKTNKVVAELLADTYKWDSNFELSIQSNNISVVKLFLDRGKYVQRYQFRLALETWKQDMLTLLINSGKIDLIDALYNSIDFRNIKCISLIANKIKEDPSIKIPSSLYQRGIKTNNMEIIDILKDTVSSPSVMTYYEVEELFKLENREIIEKMVASGLDLGNALLATVKMADEPRQNYIRRLRGDNTPVDYYWYDLVDKILAKNPPAKDVERAIRNAHINGKTTLLERLLAMNPDPTPEEDQLLDLLIKDPYLGDSIFQDLIRSNNVLGVKRFLDQGQTVRLIHKILASGEVLQLLKKSDEK